MSVLVPAPDRMRQARWAIAATTIAVIALRPVEGVLVAHWDDQTPVTIRPFMHHFNLLLSGVHAALLLTIAAALATARPAQRLLAAPFVLAALAALGLCLLPVLGLSGPWDPGAPVVTTIGVLVFAPSALRSLGTAMVATTLRTWAAPVAGMLALADLTIALAAYASAPRAVTATLHPSVDAPLLLTPLLLVSLMLVLRPAREATTTG